MYDVQYSFVEEFDCGVEFIIIDGNVDIISTSRELNDNEIFELRQFLAEINNPNDYRYFIQRPGED